MREAAAVRPTLRRGARDAPQGGELQAGVNRLPDPVAAAWCADFVSLADAASTGECGDTDALSRSPESRLESDTPGIFRGWVASNGVLLVPAVAALALAAFLYRHVSPGVEFLLLALALVALGGGHLLIRSRSRRVSAEHEARRVRDELALRAKVAECEARRNRLADFSRLAAQIAHEVRNPLSSIVLNTELLEEELGACSMPGMSEVRGLVSSIKVEAERLHALTDEYLLFARLPALEREPTPLNHVVRDLAHFVEAEAQQHRVAVAVATDPGNPVAVVDRRQIRQVVYNLVRNALEAMPAGGRVTLHTGADRTRVFIEVSDSGPGVAPELRESIFEPFFSTKNRGTGLGLPIARRIVREHGGEIDVCGTEGGCFRVWLPAAGASPALVAPGSSRQEAELQASVG